MVKVGRVKTLFAESVGSVHTCSKKTIIENMGFANDLFLRIRIRRGAWGSSSWPYHIHLRKLWFFWPFLQCKQIVSNDFWPHLEVKFTLLKYCLHVISSFAELINEEA